MIREPVVSGQFYPQTAPELKKIIEEFKPKAAAKVWLTA
jgi:AmmeMemoRadiSam system protein B